MAPPGNGSRLLLLRAVLGGHFRLTVPGFGGIPDPWQAAGLLGLRRWLHTVPSFLSLTRALHTVHAPVSRVITREPAPLGPGSGSGATVRKAKSKH